MSDPPLSCERARPPLKTGKVVYYRPNRRKPRKYTSKDLARVFRYVSCNETPQEALCASLVAAGKDEAISSGVEALAGLKGKLGAYTSDDPFSSLDALLFTILAKLNDILEKIQARRFLRFLAKRILLVKLISEVIDYILDFTEIVQALVPVLKELDELLGECDCRKINARLE